MKILVFIFSFLFLSTSAEAQVAVQGVFRILQANERPIKNVNVFNTSESDNVQVTVSAHEVTFPDSLTETQTVATDLKFAPKNFVLPAKSEKLVRIFKTSAPDANLEKLYRIHFKPSTVAKELQDDASSEADTKVNVKILTSMGILLAAAPQQIKPSLTYERTDGKVTLLNTGNVTLHMRANNVLCESSNGCTKLIDRYLPPNRKWTFDVSSNAEFTYFYEVYGKPNSIRIKAKK